MSTKSAINFRTTYVFLGVAVVALGALAVYIFIADDKKPKVANALFETFTSLGVKPQDINGLDIERGGEKIVFSRQPDGRWRITQPIVARADSDVVEGLVAELLALRHDDKGADVTSNLATHGLDSPTVKITLFSGTRSAWLALGKTTIGGDQAVVYALSGDDPKTPHAVRKLRLRSLFKEKPPTDSGLAGMVRGLDDWRTRKLLGEGLRLEAAPIEVDSVTLTMNLPNKDQRIVMLSRKNAEKAWRFVSPAGYGDVVLDVPPEQRHPGAIYNLSSLFANILGIEVFEAADFLPARDLAPAGLDPAAEGVLRIDLERDDPIGKETLWVSKSIVKSELNKVYVRYDNEAAIAQVNGERPLRLQQFVMDPSGLRDKTVLKLRRDRVDAVDITINKKSFELRKVNGRWRVGDSGSKSDANDDIMTLIDKLSQPRLARGFPPADASAAVLGFDQPAVEIKFWQDGSGADAKDAPKLRETPTVRLLFGKKDSEGFVYVRRITADDRADFKIPVELLELASKDRLDYVNVALSAYNPGNVAKIAFLRNGETWELEREAGDKPLQIARWTVLAPPARKGKLGNSKQISDILGNFADAKAGRIVAEKPAADQLAGWGLDPAKPVFKLTLSFKDKTVERTYFMGNPVAGTHDVYAKSSQNDFVFEWPLAKMESVTKGPILDLTLYSIKPEDVKGMKLRGWVDAAKPGEPKTLDLERKAGGVWAARNGVAVDDLRLEEFLANISRPEAIEQVVEKAGPKPEHGLDLKQGALEIQIDPLEGKPITLTLGRTAGKDSKRIYASTNQLPGDVFIIDGERLLNVREKMDTFLRGEEKK